MCPRTTSTFLLLLLTTVTVSGTKPTPVFPEEAVPTSSGYLPISSTSSSTLYYAFYEAQQPHPWELHRIPLLLWLQGGPGCSSMVGNLFELGPWLLTGGNHTDPFLEPNPYSWNRIFGMLFVDNPVGTGFSVASNTGDIPSNQSAVADHLFFALQAFFSSNPTFRRRPFYVTGESYGGKYVPAIAHHIQQKNTQVDSSLKINLAGIAIGNGLTHPVTQVTTHAATAYYSSLISKGKKLELENLQSEAVRLTNAEEWAAAADARNRLLRSLQNATGLATLYDLRRKWPYETGRVPSFLEKEEVRVALGVTKPQRFEECSHVVGAVLHEDVMKSTKFMVESLLGEGDVRVLLYQGQFDLRDGVVSTEAWLEEMEWEEIGSFMGAPREVWRVEGHQTPAGYVQTWGALTHIVVGGAGHLVPADQGRSSQAMIESWVMEGEPSSLLRGGLGHRRRRKKEVNHHAGSSSVTVKIRTF